MWRVCCSRCSVFFDKLREGARVYIPESTYCHLPYGIEGMEIILHAAGLCIEHFPSRRFPDDGGQQIGSRLIRE